jgi:hypothetical protein
MNKNSERMAILLSLMSLDLKDTEMLDEFFALVGFGAHAKDLLRLKKIK